MKIEFFLPIQPVAKGRPRFSKQGYAYTPTETRAFETQLKQLSRPYAPKEPILGPIHLTAVFFLWRPKSAPKSRMYPEVKPDLDNLLKAVEDSLGAFWRDDAQVCKTTTGKYYAPSDQKVGILIRIESMGSDDRPFAWLR